MIANSQKIFIAKWKDLEKWIIPPLVFQMKILPQGWTIVAVGDIVKQINTKVKVEPDQEYKMVGVKWYGEGTFHRETVGGAFLSASYVTPLKPDAFIYNRLFAWKGSFAIVPKEHRDCYVSNEFPQFVVDERRIIPRYLYLFFMLESTIDAVYRASIGSAAVSRNRFKEHDFNNFKIPLPTLTIQQAIVDYWETSQNEISDIHEKLAYLETTVAKDALRDAGIVIKDLLKKPKVFYLQWKDFERWGVEFNRWEWSPKDLLLSSTYPMKALSEIAYVNPTNFNENKFKEDETVSFIPMEAVDDKAGEISTVQSRKYKDVKTGYTRFKERDILWAKITPCMQNGKFAIARNLHKGTGFGSTEFHVVRSKSEEVFLPEYAWLLLRLVHIRNAAQRYFIGSAGQQRVPADFLRELQMPLPPIEVQKAIIQKIMAIQNEMAHERKKAEQLSASAKSEIEEMILGVRPVT